MGRGSVLGRCPRAPGSPGTALTGTRSICAGISSRPALPAASARATAPAWAVRCSPPPPPPPLPPPAPSGGSSGPCRPRCGSAPAGSDLPAVGNRAPRCGTGGEGTVSEGSMASPCRSPSTCDSPWHPKHSPRGAQCPQHSPRGAQCPKYSPQGAQCPQHSPVSPTQPSGSSDSQTSPQGAHPRAHPPKLSPAALPRWHRDMARLPGVTAHPCEGTSCCVCLQTAPAHPL